MRRRKGITGTGRDCAVCLARLGFVPSAITSRTLVGANTAKRVVSDYREVKKRGSEQKYPCAICLFRVGYGLKFTVKRLKAPQKAVLGIKRRLNLPPSKRGPIATKQSNWARQAISVPREIFEAESRQFLIGDELSHWSDHPEVSGYRRWRRAFGQELSTVGLSPFRAKLLEFAARELSRPPERIPFTPEDELKLTFRVLINTKRFVKAMITKHEKHE